MLPVEISIYGRPYLNNHPSLELRFEARALCTGSVIPQHPIPQWGNPHGSAALNIRSLERSRFVSSPFELQKERRGGDPRR